MRALALALSRHVPATCFAVTLLFTCACSDAALLDDAGMLRAELAPGEAAATPRLFFLDITGGRVLSAKVDGSDVRVLVSGLRASPDGVAVDAERGHVYWTHMGVPSADDGSIYRADLDGKNVTTIVRPGGAFTPKQLTLDAAGGYLYWSDREGMRVMRCKLDGSAIETLVVTGEGPSARSDAAKWAVGIALDLAGGYVYWTQKGPDDGHRGSIRRAHLALPSGQTASTRSDVEVLFDALPEPIDLALDLTNRLMYWTDRGDNTVSSAPLQMPATATAKTRTDRTILVRGLREAIGVSLDLAHGALYYTDLGGSVGTSALDGSGAHTLLRGQGALTGITYVQAAK